MQGGGPSFSGDRELRRDTREANSRSDRCRRRSPAVAHFEVDGQPDAQAPSSGNVERIDSAPRFAGQVLLVDDHALFAEALADALDQSGVDVALAESTEPEAIVAQIAAGAPEVAIVDFHLGADRDATPLIAMLSSQGVATIVVTADASRTVAARCYEAGARGVFGKGIPLETLLTALESAADGSPLIDGAERHALLTELRLERTQHRARLTRFQSLTVRESEVLGGLCEGRSAGEIAEAFFVSVATVRSQIRAILTKLQVNSQLAAVTEAYRLGWVDSRRENQGSSPWDVHK